MPATINRFIAHPSFYGSPSEWPPISSRTEHEEAAFMLLTPMIFWRKMVVVGRELR
jgi:hypothetical protein